MPRGQRELWIFQQRRAGSSEWTLCYKSPFEGLWEDAVCECAKIRRRAPWRTSVRVHRRMKCPEFE